MTVNELIDNLVIQLNDLHSFKKRDTIGKKEN